MLKSLSAKLTRLNCGLRLMTNSFRVERFNSFKAVQNQKKLMTERLFANAMPVAQRVNKSKTANKKIIADAVARLDARKAEIARMQAAND